MVREVGVKVERHLTRNIPDLEEEPAQKRESLAVKEEKLDET